MKCRDKHPQMANVASRRSKTSFWSETAAEMDASFSRFWFSRTWINRSPSQQGGWCFCVSYRSVCFVQVVPLGPKAGVVQWVGNTVAPRGPIPLRGGLFCFKVSLIGIFSLPPRILPPYRGTGMGTAGQRPSGPAEPMPVLRYVDGIPRKSGKRTTEKFF